MSQPENGPSLGWHSYNDFMHKRANLEKVSMPKDELFKDTNKLLLPLLTIPCLDEDRITIEEHWGSYCRNELLDRGVEAFT
jgi:hypothetical protein